MVTLCDISEPEPLDAFTPGSLSYESKIQRMQEAVRCLLQGIGEDCQREGLVDTPKRVAKALMDLCQGYRVSSSSVIGSALFHETLVNERDGLVLVKDIDFASTSCETLLPFHGRCHVAYYPDQGTVLGLSKLARLTKLFAKRIQSQAGLTHQLQGALAKHLVPKGLAVVVEAKHLGFGRCDEKITIATSGLFQEETHLQELLCVLGIVPEEVDAGLGPGADALVVPAALELVQPPVTPDPSENDEDDDTDMSYSNKGMEAMEAAMQQLLLEAGVKVSDQVLMGSIRRYVSGLLATTSGYHQDPLQATESTPYNGAYEGLGREPCVPRDPPGSNCWDEVVRSGTPRHCRCGAYSEPVGLESDTCYEYPPACSALTAGACWHEHRVRFWSHCEHHMLPFYGVLWVVYLLPHGVSPLTSSQIDLVVSTYTHRLQIQERITHQVALAINRLASPLGVMVVCDAAHMCMVARGVENHAGSTLTSLPLGTFEKDSVMRMKVMQMVRRTREEFEVK